METWPSASCLLFYQLPALFEGYARSSCRRLDVLRPTRGGPLRSVRKLELGKIFNMPTYHACLKDFSLFLGLLMDFGQIPRAPDVCPALWRVFYGEAKCITQFLSHGIFYYVVGDTVGEPEKWREQLNWIAFINQCHIMHSEYRLECHSVVGQGAHL